MNPKPVHYIGLLACIITLMASCHSSQSTTYAKPKKMQQIQLPSVAQQMQVEVVQPMQAELTQPKQAEVVSGKTKQ